MYWKYVKLFRPNSWSLSSKLVMLSCISSLSVLSVASFFFYPAIYKVKLSAHQKAHQVSHTLVTKDCEHDVTVACFKEIIFVLLICSISATSLSYFVVRKILNKIACFSQQLESVSAHSLNEKIELSNWPHEFIGLGNSFNQMLDRLERFLKQQARFSSDLAHELRTPINNLRGITELALLNDYSIEEYQDVLASNIEEYNHLSNIIDKLLFLAKADHDQICVLRVKSNIREQINKIIDYYQAVANEKQIRIYCVGEAAAAIDCTLFAQAISNIMTNALKYTPSLGSISITINTSNDKVAINISDTGQGIDQKNLPFIFDRFYRADTSRNTQSGGVGLGLSLTKSIIALHKGEIYVTSSPNVGTDVKLIIPNY